jgi:proline dehydrogenase
MFNKWIAGVLPFMPKGFVWIFSKKYIAGAKVDDAIRVSRELNRKNMLSTIDVLGEFIETTEQAEVNKQEYLALIDRVCGESIDCSFSVKPTSFGLLIDRETCYRHLREIVSRAKEYKRMIRLDMEDSKCVDDELALFKRLYNEFPANVGIVLQVYLHRTYQDILDLSTFLNKKHPINVRLCKGIYVESPTVAFKDKEEIRKHYIDDLKLLIEKGFVPAIATHDKFLIKKSLEFIQTYQLNKSDYEFQMLYGVAESLRDQLVIEGHQMRVYVPYGQDWFGYSTRRLKENPKVVNHIMKSILHLG